MSESSRYIHVDEVEVVVSESSLGINPSNEGEKDRSIPDARPLQTVKDGVAEERNNTGSVSVIIPFTRIQTIGGTIESIWGQDYPQRQLEVVVVGNGSSQLLSRWAGVRVVDDGMGYSPGRARNQGAKHASGEFLIFIDDDCEAQPGWIRESLTELDGDSVGAVGGMVSSKLRSAISQGIDFANFGMCQTDRRQERPICSATFAIRKDLFQAAGGFDEQLLVHEDIDLCHRLHLRGYKTIYQPKVRVVHNHERTNLGQLLRYMYHGGRHGGLRIEQKYVDLSKLYRFLLWFKNPLAYLVAVIPFAIAATIRTAKLNLREHKQILYLWPLVLLAKASCHLGIWKAILNDNVVNSWRRIGTIQNARRLLEYTFLKRFLHTPRELTLFVTSQCNAKCGHCFYWQGLNQPTDLSLDEIRALSRTLGKLDKLLITGGEPFLRRELPEIIHHFFKHNDLNFVSIPTNGLLPRLIANQTRRILQGADGRTVNVSISLDGFGVVHDNLRGVPGNFEKAVGTYRELRELQRSYTNLSLRVNSVVMNATADGIDDLIEELPRLMPEINTPALTLLRGSPLDKSLLLPDIDRLKELHRHKSARTPGKQPFLWRLADWATYTLSLEILKKDTQVVPCEAGRVLGVVEADGTVKHCELLPPIGNLRQQTFNEIWNSADAQRARQKIVNKECRCTHECNLFPSILAHPVRAGIALARASRKRPLDSP